MTTPKSYTLRNAVGKHKAGRVVYNSMRHNYGPANDMSRETGRRHLSVSVDPSGFPSFIVAEEDLDEGPAT